MTPPTQIPYLVNEGVEGWMEPHELAWLAGIAAMCPNGVVEIGSWKGRSARALAHTPGLLVCIDHFQGDGTPAHAEAASHPAAVRQAFLHNIRDIRNLVLVTDPIETIRPHRIFSLSKDLSGPDLVFIDGSHDRASVDRDIAWAHSVVRVGGVIAGHDYKPGTWDDVVASVHANFRSFRRGPDTIWYAAREECLCK